MPDLAFFPVDWVEYDEAVDAVALEARRARDAHANASSDESGDDDGAGDEGALERTCEIRVWAQPRPRTDRPTDGRVLLRFQRVPVHAYLELPRRVPLSQKEAEPRDWTQGDADAVAAWIRRILPTAKPRFGAARGPMRLTSYELVRRDRLHFYRPESHGVPFLLLHFNTIKARSALKNAIQALTPKEVEVGPSGVAPLPRAFVHGVAPGWAPLAVALHETDIDIVRHLTSLRRVSRGECLVATVAPVDRASRASICAKHVPSAREYFADWRTLRVAPNPWAAPPRVLSFDLEANSSRGENFFPNALILGDDIKMFSMVVRVGETVTERTLLTTSLGLTEGRRESAEAPAFDIVVVSSERDLLLAFCDEVNRIDPDIITGHNIRGFDIPYIYQRMTVHAITPPNISRMEYGGSRVSERIKKLDDGSAVNDIEWIIPGRVVFDLIDYLRKEKKDSASFKLDAFARDVLNEHKLEVSPQEMFRVFKLQSEGKVNETIERIERIADYCIVDAELVHRLIARMLVLTGLKEFVFIMGVAMADLYTRGEQCRVFSKIADAAHEAGIVVDEVRWNFVPTAGATVQTARRGIHDRSICLDFSGMYPSIIRGYNICHSTLILPEDYDKYPKSDCNIFEIEQIEDIEFGGAGGTIIREVSHEEAQAIKDDETDDGAVNEAGLARIRPTVVGKDAKATTRFVLVRREVRFIKSEIREGLLPRILRELTAARKAAKGEMKKYKEHSLEYALWDMRQLALKITSNAAYGFTGAQRNGIRPLPLGFICVTARGRELILTVIRYVTSNYAARVVYGDTDSAFFVFDDVATPMEALARGKELETAVNKLFPPPIAMEFEKAVRMVLFKKKMYAFIKIGKDGEFEKNGAGTGPHITVKGIKTARRDNAAFQRAVMSSAVEEMLALTSPVEIIRRAAKPIADLLRGTAPLEFYAINTGTAVYDDDSTSKVKVLMDTMASLNAPITPGDRVDYIVADIAGVEKKSERYIELSWIMKQPENERPMLDMAWYLTDGLKAMNETLGLAIDHWTQGAPERAAAVKGLTVMLPHKRGERMTETAITFADEPMSFITRCALASRDAPDNFDRFIDWLVTRLETARTGIWNAGLGSPSRHITDFFKKK